MSPDSKHIRLCHRNVADAPHETANPVRTGDAKPRDPSGSAGIPIREKVVIVKSSPARAEAERMS
jgi:hypothetical protein